MTGFGGVSARPLTGGRSDPPEKAAGSPCLLEPAADPLQARRQPVRDEVHANPDVAWGLVDEGLLGV